MKIAVIGSGISGLSAAHYLQRFHDVSLFERDSRFGGHAHTVSVWDDATQSHVNLDMAFLVFNTVTYPNFVHLLNTLKVPSVASSMSLSLCSKQHNVEFNGSSLSGLFAHKRNAFSWSFWRMLADVARFYRHSPQALLDTDSTVSEWVQRHKYSKPFFDIYLKPLIQAIWSAHSDSVEQSSIHFIVGFLRNHGLLQFNTPIQWRAVENGSITYVKALLDHFKGEALSNADVVEVRRHKDKVKVTIAGHTERLFDHVVMACNADQAQRIITDKTDQEHAFLKCFPSQRNEAVLHTDHTAMPHSKKAWASWNVKANSEHSNYQCAITYWLNSLRALPTSTDFFVTLNQTESIDPNKIIQRQSYYHPIFAKANQTPLRPLWDSAQERRISFCGAYLRNGFHEDGVWSAIKACQALGGDITDQHQQSTSESEIHPKLTFPELLSS